MKKNRYIVIILLIIIFLILGIFYFVTNDNRRLTVIEIGIKESVLFVEKIFDTPVKFITSKIDELHEMKSLYKNLKKQNQKLQDYDFLNATLKEKEKRIKELEDTLEIKNNYSNYDTISAGVINRNVAYWYDIMTIDKGSNDGIKKNMAVITKKGLVGKISKTTPNTSVVKLLTSINELDQIAVYIDNNGENAYGLLSEYKKYKFLVNGLSYNKAINKNAPVMTSGLDNLFPSGILIGYVEDTFKDNFDLEQNLSIIPSNSFDDINYVLVLKRQK